MNQLHQNSVKQNTSKKSPDSQMDSVKTRSHLALLARGLDSNLASKLENKGFTLKKLIQLKKKLISLGISDSVADSFLQERRPPIDLQVIVKLLSESRGLCCVYRDPKKSIVIHHLRGWEKSRDNHEKNLVVICLEHHGEAHTDHKLSRNLTPDVLIQMKDSWINEVSHLDSLLIRQRASAESARWDYINNTRVFELIAKSHVNTQPLPMFNYLRHLNILDSLGCITGPSTWQGINRPRMHLYDFGGCIQLYIYMKAVMDSLLSVLPVTNLGSNLLLTRIRTQVMVGRFISFDGGIYYRNKSKKHTGKGQTRIGYKQANGIRIEFNFDAWEATSTSAWGDHLKGHTTSNVICLVKHIGENNGGFTIRTSCLAIGSYFDGPQEFNLDDLIKKGCNSTAMG